MNQNKKIVLITVIILVVSSVVLSYIMGTNMRKQSSQMRTKLTREYKKAKDVKYTYDASVAEAKFNQHCISCHKTEFKTISKDGLITTAIRGKGEMPGFKYLESLDLAHVLNYVGKRTDITPVDIVVKKVEAIGKY